MELSIVIPTLNEANNLLILLPKLRTTLDKLDCAYEVVIADGGSKDGTLEVACQYGVSAVVKKKGGYGIALRAAFNRCRGKFIITMDADLSHNPYVIRQLYQKRYVADIVIASRYIRGGFANISLTRKILSLILNKAFRSILDIPLKDISSGFRLYNRRVLKNLKLKGRHYEILQEIVIKAYREGYDVAEIPFHYFPRFSGRSHVHLLTFFVYYLRNLVQFWKQRNSIMSGDYDERAFYSRIPLQRYWQRKRYHIVLKFLENRENLLDIGCGSSKILEAIPQSVGMDIALSKLRFRRRLINPLVNGDILALPFKNDCFDEIICSEVIGHVPENEKIFDELSRVLKRGGNLIIGTPDYSKKLWRIIERTYKFVHPGGYAHEPITHYTFESLIEKLEKHGFEVNGHEYIVGCELIIKAMKLPKILRPNSSKVDLTNGL